MLAALYKKTGSARDVLKICDVPAPCPKKNELLIRVNGSGINPADVKRRSGWRGVSMAHKEIIPHCDGAGEVIEVGSDIQDRKVGDRVWLWNAQGGYDGPGRASGTAAEYIAIPENQTAILHPDLNFLEGACLGVPAMTAHYAVFSDGSVRGKTVLIQGGGGVVGHFAIQFAVSGGARVIATAGSAKRKSHALEAGAIKVLDRKDSDIINKIYEITDGKGVDRIVELEFGANLHTDFAVLKPRGVIAAYSSTQEPNPCFPYYTLATKGGTLHVIQSFGFSKAIRQKAIKYINELCDFGQLNVAIGKIYPLDKISVAHDLVEQQEICGNVVLRI